MSRIIVKNLPIYFTEDKLKEHFLKVPNGTPTITDIKLKRNNIGESRRFAFIGYKDSKDAEYAIKYFNGSFINTAKIQVLEAKSFNDPNVPRSWKDRKHDAGIRLKETELKLKKLEELNNKKNNKKKQKLNAIDDRIENDKNLKEFLETMKPSTQSKSWNNDMVTPDQVSTATPSEESQGPINGNVSSIPDAESDDDYEDFHKKASDDDEEEEQFVSLSQANQDEEVMKVEEGDDGNKEQSLDDWIQSKRKRIRESDADEIQKSLKEKYGDEQLAPTLQEEPEIVPKLTQEEEAIQEISKTGRLFVRNISYKATEDDFKELFSNFGEFEEVHIALDTRTGQSKGYVFVKFVNPQDAKLAYLELDKKDFQGRILHVLPSKPKKDHTLDEYDLQNMPLKKQKDLKRKHQASKQQFTWNSLFMNNDAVLESVAASFGITKSELTNAENSESAVKQALAEAHVLGGVRKYFESQKIDLLKFGNSKEKDDKIILVKNFQYGTSKEELGELFSAYGELKRVLMPPAGTIAIIEFRDASSGRTAFNKLAFRRLGKSILYLEKGPKDLFTGEPEDVPVFENKEEGKEAKITTEDVWDTEIKEEDHTGPTVSIFVKNLNFSTTQANLTELFKPIEGFILATIKTKPDVKNSGKFLSMGFGFAEFKTLQQAKAAINAFDGYSLDGHQLQLKISNRASNTSSKGSNAVSKKKKSTKIIVKNLPFESTRRDLVSLFQPFGNLKSVRVPKKFNKSARGFAFIEYSTIQETASAMDQLQGVHLLGRRLVLDYAEQETDVESQIEKMTKRAKRQTQTRQMADLRETYSGKRKLDLDEDEDEL